MPASPYATPADPSVLDPAALARAERARRNGARSRGPRTPMGKARSSRNALKHGFTAGAGLVVRRGDEAAFRGMAERLFAELAPAGELEGFLVADLAAAMWRTGRAQRLEAQAFAGDEPDLHKLGLALRYHGSASRELFRVLRTLEGLRRRKPTPEGAAPEPARPADPEAPVPLPPVAGLAWGGGAPPPTPPPPAGCLMLRPVPGKGPRIWHWHQELAFPGAVPVPVDADGTVYALEDGAWAPQPAPPRQEPPWRPRAERSPPPPAAEDTLGEGPDAAAPPHDGAPPRRNEPSQTVDLEPNRPAPDPWSRLWGLAPPAGPAGAG
jgi:hypothetical protein